MSMGKFVTKWNAFQKIFNDFIAVCMIYIMLLAIKTRLLSCRCLTSSSTLVIKTWSDPLRSPQRTSDSLRSENAIWGAPMYTEFGHLCRQWGKRKVVFFSKLKVLFVARHSTDHQMTNPSAPHENRLWEFSRSPFNQWRLRTLSGYGFLSSECHDGSTGKITRSKNNEMNWIFYIGLKKWAVP